MRNPIPLSLYIHIPWCLKKCPYCDFNSYASKEILPEKRYIETLLKEVEQDLPFAMERPIISIFFGGGTPSLFSPNAFESILDALSKKMCFANNIEITMEANPGALEHKNFNEYAKAGINRISLGAQSFQTDKLKQLGRVHNEQDIYNAIESIHRSTIQKFNIDIMFGLPNQSLSDALSDLKIALESGASHLSWYHLTLEPNTYFHKYPPTLPKDSLIHQIQKMGVELIQAQGLKQYEISAFAKPGFECIHNLNYWQFGDYLGIGAGAHGKISDDQTKTIFRYAKTRLPNAYFSNFKPLSKKMISIQQRPFEFMLNALRLCEDIPKTLFEERTFLPFSSLNPYLKIAKEKNWIIEREDHFTLTKLGKTFSNDVMALFLEEEVDTD